MKNSSIIHAIEQRADVAAHAPALQDGAVTLSYAEMAQRIDSLAKALQASGARCVAIEMDNGIEWVLADLACLKAGIPTLPLPPFFTPMQREHALRQAGAHFCFMEGLQLVPLDFKAVALPEGTAKVTFTSGSTGDPKGICLTVDGMEHVALSLKEVLGDAVAARTAALLPLGVLLENVAGCYTTLLSGGCYDVRPQHTIGLSRQPNFDRLLAYLSDSKATACILVPELLRGLVAAINASSVALPEMRFMAVGGAKVSPLLLEQASALGLPVYEGYGLTESASVVAVNTPQAFRHGSVGRMLPHVRITIAADGEILLCASAMADAKNHATGDIGFFDDEGFLHITGRKKNVLITANGRNISPEWPESALLAQPEIIQAIVVGDAAPHLAALIVSSAPDMKVEKAIAQANKQLPLYAQLSAWRRVPAFSSANGQLTGNGRLRRDTIMQTHHSLIQSIYEEQYDAALL